jgi:hypothetical protein
MKKEEKTNDPFLLIFVRQSTLIPDVTRLMAMCDIVAWGYVLLVPDKVKTIILDFESWSICRGEIPPGGAVKSGVRRVE